MHRHNAWRDKGMRKPFKFLLVVVAPVMLAFLYLAGMPLLNRPIPCKGCSKNYISRMQVEELIATISAFASDTGRYPTSAEGLDALVHNPGNQKDWKGPYPKKMVPNDPWGRAYIYLCPGMRNPDYYDLWSNGSDGIEGTEDDITN
jgi:general secretion pathway protein G